MAPPVIGVWPLSDMWTFCSVFLFSLLFSPSHRERLFSNSHRPRDAAKQNTAPEARSTATTVVATGDPAEPAALVAKKYARAKEAFHRDRLVRNLDEIKLEAEEVDGSSEVVAVSFMALFLFTSLSADLEKDRQIATMLAKLQAARAEKTGFVAEAEAEGGENVSACHDYQ
ncbi:hypothetical protein S40293_10893 [Stachybotrys chartarum IBT 40293]|nr:hypothetical protein S40293_10893 [Stachybotrys chartarum IBT 40293]